MSQKSSRRQELLSRLKTTLAIVSQQTGFDDKQPAGGAQPSEHQSSSRDPRLRRQEPYQEAAGPGTSAEYQVSHAGSTAGHPGGVNLHKYDEIQDEDEFLYGSTSSPHYVRQPVSDSGPDKRTAETYPARDQWVDQRSTQDVDLRWGSASATRQPTYNDPQQTVTQHSGDPRWLRNADPTTASQAPDQTPWMQTASSGADGHSWDGGSRYSEDRNLQDRQPMGRGMQAAPRNVPADLASSKLQGINTGMLEGILKLVAAGTSTSATQPQQTQQSMSLDSRPEYPNSYPPQDINKRSYAPPAVPQDVSNVGMIQQGQPRSSTYGYSQSTPEQQHVTDVNPLLSQLSAFLNSRVPQTSGQPGFPESRVSQTAGQSIFPDRHMSGQPSFPESRVSQTAGQSIFSDRFQMSGQPGLSENRVSQMSGQPGFPESRFTQIAGQSIFPDRSQISGQPGFPENRVSQTSGQLGFPDSVVSQTYGQPTFPDTRMPRTSAQSGFPESGVSQMPGHPVSGHLQRLSGLAEQSASLNLPPSYRPVVTGADSRLAVNQGSLGSVSQPASMFHTMQPQSNVPEKLPTATPNAPKPDAAGPTEASQPEKAPAMVELEKGDDVKVPPGGGENKDTLSRLLNMIGCNSNVSLLMQELIKKDKQGQAAKQQTPEKQEPEPPLTALTQKTDDTKLSTFVGPHTPPEPSKPEIAELDDKSKPGLPPESVKPSLHVEPAKVVEETKPSIPVLSSLVRLQRNYDSPDENSEDSEPALKKSSNAKDVEWERSTDEFLRRLQSKHAAPSKPQKKEKQWSDSHERNVKGKLKSRPASEGKASAGKQPKSDTPKAKDGREQTKEMSSAEIESERADLLRGKREIEGALELLQKELTNLRTTKNRLLESPGGAQRDAELGQSIENEQKLTEHMLQLKSAMAELNSHLEKLSSVKVRFIGSCFGRLICRCVFLCIVSLRYFFNPSCPKFL